MELIIILSALCLGFSVTLVFLRNWLNTTSRPDTAITEWLKSVSLSLDNSTRLMADVHKSLGEMSEVGRGIKSLQEFLQSPKIRGGLGEEILSQMIGSTFPKSAFHLQYRFKTGYIVDAVLKTDAGLLCIDSKFPHEDFQSPAFVSSVKKHISDIAQKYIVPDEGTMDFALMYIPSESIYYEVVNSRELTKLARDLRVYPVSPNTLYAHLQVLLQSLQGQKLEAKSKEIFRILRSIQSDYSHLGDNLTTLGRHLTNASNQMSQVHHGFDLLGQKLSKSQNLSLPEKDDTSST